MMKENIYNPVIDEDLDEIKKAISRNLIVKDSKVRCLLDCLGADKGKLLRGTFALIGGSFGNIEKKRLINIGAAVELLHLATLVHDDIIDESSLRRGQETINSSFGVKPALFAGDYLFSQSYVLFSKNISPEGITFVSETIKAVCKSEINQFFSSYSFESSIRSYLKRISGKCACLFSLSLSIGACEGFAAETVTKKLKKIGYYIGMAFQLMDDILDITTPDEVLGKPAGNDIIQGIYTLPIIYELKNGNTALLDLIKNGNISEAVLMLRKAEGLAKAKEFAEKYTSKALKLIDELPNSFEREYLKKIAEVMLIRRY